MWDFVVMCEGLLANIDMMWRYSQDHVKLLRLRKEQNINLVVVGLQEAKLQSNGFHIQSHRDA